MKKIYQSICISLVSLFIFGSCDDLMDVHKKYIEDGEIIYAQNLDSMVFYAGHNKTYLQFWTLNATNIKSVDLYWDEDSLITLVTPSPGLDSVMVEVPTIEEKSYTFKVRTTDVFGNHSLWNTGFANSYGDFFIESLNNRLIKGFEIIEDYGKISWFPSASNLVRSEIRYIDLNEQEQIINIPSDQAETICPGLINNQFEVRSFFLPEVNSIDTFAVEWEAMNPLYRLPRDKWTIKYCNSWQGRPNPEGTQNVPKLIFDGKFDTFWHSSWATYDAGTNPLDPNLRRDPPPLTLVIDLGEAVDIMQIDIYRRLNNNNTQTVIAYGALDDTLITDEDIEWRGETPVPEYASDHAYFPSYSYSGIKNDRWVELGRCEYSSASNLDTPEKNQQVIDASLLGVKSRYLKLILPNSRSNGNVSLAEIFISTR